MRRAALSLPATTEKPSYGTPGFRVRDKLFARIREEGDVLVVDTVGFLPGTLRGTTPHSDKLHVVERFTLNPTTLELTRDIVAEDPEYFVDKYVDTDSVLPADAPFRVEACQELAPEYQQTGRN